MSHVGIFWFVPSDEPGTSTLVADMTPIAEAPDYAGFKTHDRGHSEYWSGLAYQGAAALRRQGLPHLIVTVEYETYPRGRIVFDPSRQHYMIYADRGLHKRAFIAAILQRFGIEKGSYTVLGDLHYSRSRPVPAPAPRAVGPLTRR